MIHLSVVSRLVCLRFGDGNLFGPGCSPLVISPVVFCVAGANDHFVPFGAGAINDFDVKKSMVLDRVVSSHLLD